MSGLVRSIRNWSCLAVALVMLTSVASSAVFTAVASGNFNAAATWGGAAPNINNTVDQINIPAGITVTLDNNVTINGLLASMTVAGMLTGGANSTLTVMQGSLAGAGTINVGTLNMGVTSALSFTGALTVEYLNNASTVIQSAANLTVTRGLNLTGGVFTTATGGTTTLANDATITLSGGLLAINGGALALANNYNVRYTTTAATTGLELSGAGLRTVMFDVPVGTAVTLGNNLVIGANGGLNLSGGTLMLNGRDLTINGALTSAANTAIISTSASSIVINSATGSTGALNFTGVGNAVKNLTVNIGQNNVTTIMGAVNVTNMLTLTSGTLRFVNSTLTLSGGVTGAGSLSGDATSNLVVNTVGGIQTPLRFAADGQTINDLTVNVGAANAVRLGSALVVNGTTSLMNGNLNISDVTLTLNGAVTGAGQFIINAASGLIVETNAGLTNALNFSGSTIGALTINTDAGQTVMLGTDLIVAQALSLQGGTLVLNGNDLTVAGDILASANGSIRSTSASNITLSSVTGTTGALNFSGVGNAVGNLIVNVGAANTARITGTLDVVNGLNLQSGTLNFAGSTLNLMGPVTGTGSLSGSSTSNLVVNSASGVGSGLRFATGGQTLNNLTINSGAGTTVRLLSDLVVTGATTLTSGNLDISDNDLAIGGALTGTGTIVSNAGSGLMINTPGGLTSPVTVTGGTIGAFGVNVGTGNSVILGSDLNVLNTLTLNSGVLNLNGNDLTVDGNIVGGVTGSVRSTVASNISLTGSNGTTGILNFADGSEVGNLLVDVGATNSAIIGGNVDVMNTLNLTSGTLDFSGADLTLNGLVTGTGMLSADSTSNLTINTIGGLASGLRFANGGQTLNNLTVNVGASNTVVLASDLVVNGTTTLTGTLDISDMDFTLGGALSGTGSILANANSSLSIMNEAGLTSALNLTGSSLGRLMVDVGNNASVMLGNDLNITQMLDLENGMLDLNGNDLNITGTIDATGTGRIASSNTSNISITSTSQTISRLMFDATANTVNNLTIAVGNTGSVMLGSDATVDGVLNLTSGRLNIADNVLEIGTNGSIVGASTTSYIQTALNGSVSMAVDAGASVATVFPVGTNLGFFPAAIMLAQGSASGNVNVGVRQGVFSHGTSGSLLSATESVVNATWDITSDITSNLRMNMELAWQAAAEANGFNRTQAFISHYVNGNWDASAMAAARTRADGMYSIERDNVQSLSPFAVFDGATTDVAADITGSYNLYPSPATDVITIENLASAVSMNIDIVDAQGRVVASSVMNGTRHDISLSALSSGVYFVKLHNETSIATMRFIKM